MLLSFRSAKLRATHETGHAGLSITRKHRAFQLNFKLHYTTFLSTRNLTCSLLRLPQPEPNLLRPHPRRNVGKPGTEKRLCRIRPNSPCQHACAAIGDLGRRYLAKIASLEFGLIDCRESCLSQTSKPDLWFVYWPKLPSVHHDTELQQNVSIPFQHD